MMNNRQEIQISIATKASLNNLYTRTEKKFKTLIQDMIEKHGENAINIIDQWINSGELNKQFKKLPLQKSSNVISL